MTKIFKFEWCHLLHHKAITYLIIALSGLLTPFAFAPYRHFWLMPILLGVLLWFAFSKKSPIKMAYLWGFCAYTAQFYWIYIALHNIAGLPIVYAIPLTALFSGWLAFFPALCFWGLGFFKLSENKKLVLVFPLLWTISEYLREHALTGFGWGALGYSQISESPLAGFAPVGGLQLVTFFVALVTALWIFIVRSKNFRMSVCALMLSFLIIGLGAHLKTISFTQATGQSATVALAQGNIVQSLKWDESEAYPTIDKYFQMVDETQADIMILPETALPFFQEQIPSDIERFALNAKNKNMALVIGLSRFVGEENRFVNAAVNLSDYKVDEPLNQPYYAKNHLVPFGEYIPFESITGWLYSKMDIPLVGASGGGFAQPPLNLRNQKVAFNICYEDSFGDELIASAKQATLLANISNMAWYGDSYAMDQHLQHSQMRALELGRYMVRATNTGMTAVINPQGSIEALAIPNTRQVLSHKVMGFKGSTPFMRMGSSLPLILVLGGLVFILYFVSYIHNRKNKSDHLKENR